MQMYFIIFVVLIALELGYFRIADHFNIIDKPNERSSHTKVVLRGGGVIFTIALWVWSIVYGFQYPWMLAGVSLAAGVSFVDDIHSLPDLPRLIIHILAVAVILVDVGAVGIALILLFAVWRQTVTTEDLSYLVFMKRYYHLHEAYLMSLEGKEARNGK